MKPAASREVVDVRGEAGAAVVRRLLGVVAPPADRACPPQMRQQLLFQGAARLDEERAIDRLV